MADKVHLLPSFLKTKWLRLRTGIAQEDTLHVLVIMLIVLLAVALRVRFLSQPMRYDESYTFLRYASQPLKEGLTEFYLPNNHLFHTFLVHIAFGILGNAPWVLRLPALMAGILLVPASYVMVRTFYDKHAALLAAGILASSSVFILFSTFARGYTLLTLIFVLLLTLGEHLKRHPTVVGWGMFTVLTILGFYTIPIMLYAQGVVATWFLLSIIIETTRARRLRLLLGLALSSALAAYVTYRLYLPIIRFSGLGALTSSSFILNRPLPGSLHELGQAFEAVWVQWHRDVPTPIGIALIVGFLVSTVFHWRLSERRIPLVLAVPVWLIPVLIIQNVLPFTRVWLFLLPLYVGVAAAGLSHLLPILLRSRSTRLKSTVFSLLALGIALWLGGGVLESRSVLNAGDGGLYKEAEHIVDFLGNYLEAGDVVIPDITISIPLEFYFARQSVPSEHLFGIHPDAKTGPRALIVTDQNAGSDEERLDAVMEDVHLDWEFYTQARLVRQFESATIYELRRTCSVLCN